MSARSWFISMVAGVGLLLGASATQAAVLPVGGGWQTDFLSISNAATDNSPWTFTLSAPGVFSIVDSGIAGDTFDVFDVGGLVLTTNFSAMPTYWTPLAQPGDFEWVNPTYSRGQVLLAAGSYAFDVFGNQVPGGLPAILYVRADVLQQVAVPAPAALAIFAVGLAGLLAARRRAA